METNKELMKSDSDFIPMGKENCTCCGEAIVAAELVFCSNCKTPHHSDCWRQEKGCSCENCECRISETPDDGNAITEDDTDNERWFYNDSDGSLVLDSHVDAIEDPLAGGMVMGCGGILFGALFSSWLLAHSGYLFGVSVTLFFVVDAYLRHRVTINSSGGAITRKLLLASSILSENGSYLFLDELVELHLHTEEVKSDDENEDDDNTTSNDSDNISEDNTASNDSDNMSENNDASNTPGHQKRLLAASMIKHTLDEEGYVLGPLP